MFSLTLLQKSTNQSSWKVETRAECLCLHFLCIRKFLQ